MTDGWIKLYRNLINNPIIKKPEYLVVWIYCLLRANHKENTMIIGSQKTTINSGQFITSRAKMSMDTEIQESKVERILKYLKTEQQIEQQNLYKCRLITIVNWHKYQISEQQNELEVNSKRTASEQQVNTNNKDKNVNKEKNVENNIVIPRFEIMFQNIESTFTEEQLKHKEAFIEYWTETKIGGTKQRWQMEKTFELKRRFNTWLRNNESWGNKKHSKSDEPAGLAALRELAQERENEE